MSQATAPEAPQKPRPATMARRKVYPRQVSGRLRSLRWGISFFLQVLLFAGPWLRWNGRPAILMDLEARQFHLFGLTFWPQETYFILILLVFLALLLFFSTALVGRVWCGYACPQTLLTESFLQVEFWVEGDRAKRMKRDAGPWTPDKVVRKLVKWSIWSAMALWLGVTFVAYFVPGTKLLPDLLTGAAQPTTYGFVLFFAGLAMFDFGWFREQFCHYVCPYARFQGAMFDRDSLLVAYDAKRGEPRGKATDPAAGSCVDCGLCVQVCPMGIDIRNGQQLECTTCSACVDACDGVMERLGRPKGLVRYTSLNALEGQLTRIVRPRVVIYGTLLVALATLFLTLLSVRSPLALDVLREGQMGVATRTADGRVANLYELKILNKQGRERRVRLELSGLPGAELVIPENPFALPAESRKDLQVMVLHPGQGLRPASRFEVVAVDADDPAVRVSAPTSFLAPGAGAR